MMNTLIQGSAADCTKQALINYHNIKPKHHVNYLSLHDELLSSVPRKERELGMNKMKEAMEAVEFDLPMLSEGTWSPKGWIKMKPYDKKGVRCVK
jgi:DNA polymerase I-like protein with 3'-5' exonuclease and polymerase domains